MIFLIRNLLEQALKTNNSLKFAVMTGCMRIQMNVMMNIWFYGYGSKRNAKVL